MLPEENRFIYFTVLEVKVQEEWSYMSASDEVFMADGVLKEPERWEKIQVPSDRNHERLVDQAYFSRKKKKKKLLS